MHWFPPHRTVSPLVPRRRGVPPARGPLGVILAVLLVLLAPSLAAAASDLRTAGPTAAVCVAEYEEDASPGWWLVTPGAPAISSRGTISCVGMVEGRRLAGEPGPSAYRGGYDGRMAGQEAPVLGDTCAAGSGQGTWDATLRTVDGEELVLSGPVEFAYLGAAWVMRGRLGAVSLRLVFQGYPRPGSPSDEDCVRKPLRQVSAKAEGTLGGTEHRGS
jgi:hypothetical protein